MTIGHSARVKRLEDRRDPATRFVDMAIRLVICEAIDEDGHWRETGEYKDVGGVWDRRMFLYAPDREPQTRLVRTVSRAQLKYVMSDRPRIMAAGGRGSGKTEALAQRCERLLLDWPGSAGLVVSPIYKQSSTVMGKLLRRVYPWLDGRPNRTDMMFRLITGSTVRFLSAENPDAIRSWDAHWRAVDEEKDVSDDAIMNADFCLRECATPMGFSAGTPELGAYSERYADLEEKDPGAVFRFPALENPFTPKAYLWSVKPFISQAQWEQEAEAKFVRTDSLQVAKGFSRDRHLVSDPSALGKDITRAWLRGKGKSGKDWIIGADYNGNFPCVAWVYKIHDPHPGRWIVYDRIDGVTVADLGHHLLAAGYTSRNSTLVDDASGEHFDQHGKPSPNSCSRILRDPPFFFDCLHRRANPGQMDRVNALQSKLAPADGSPARWGYKPSQAKIVERTMYNTVWNTAGTKISKAETDTVGWDHDFDAATYPIAFFDPAAMIQVPRVRPL